MMKENHEDYNCNNNVLSLTTCMHNVVFCGSKETRFMSGTSVYCIFFFVTKILKISTSFLVSVVIVCSETPIHCRRLRYISIFRILY